MLTAQEVFDKVATHFLIEKQPFSFIPERSASGLRCRYRYGDGAARCAVGIFITDEEYTDKLETIGSVNRLLEVPEARCNLSEQTVEFLATHMVLLRRLQADHDDSCHIDGDMARRRRHLHTRLRETAKQEALSSAILDQYQED